MSTQEIERLIFLNDTYAYLVAICHFYGITELFSLDDFAVVAYFLTFDTKSILRLFSRSECPPKIFTFNSCYSYSEKK